ncbi:threonine/serine exporter family protein [Streptococcus sp. 29896]|uniref:Threonine/serine exporter family protein n=1 Tax=Streptococcus suivaginalis TaxID=3028082 RepID=A0AA97AAT7_9STRE|nr:threonine/serine exporter family protein [Streptococcus sp. 29896]WNY47811.1 threonine/serine exporter family protein [Streptococcus sp. 29896]
MNAQPPLNQAIDVLMLAGAILSESGAEIHRVEDTMIRIAHSQGIQHANVLAIPAAIFFSIDHTNISRMKRIVEPKHDMQKVCQVNQVSRSLVEGEISLDQALNQLNVIKNQPLPYTALQITVAAVIAATFFTLMFGGSLLESLATALATLLAFPFSRWIHHLIRIEFVSSFAGALVFSLFAYWLGQAFPFHFNPNMINAGAVMPFVPGIAFTNAVRDLMTNHINTGMTKIFQTLLLILSLGAGTAVALLIVG